jgi:hypothetical protein
MPGLSGFIVEWGGPNDYILSRRDVLYESRELKPPFFEFGRMPLAPHLRVAARFDLARRALRLSYYNVVRSGPGRVFATFDRSIMLITPGRTKPVEGLERPFRVLRNGCAVTEDGAVWFGEYVVARELTPLHIYRLAPMSERAEIAHVFPAGFARHIHGVYTDPFDGSLWCLTGDFHEHAKILRSSNGWEAFAEIGSGDESWRAVSVQFRRDAIYYATDAQGRGNWIYRIDRRTGARTQVASLDGPVYYSHRVGDDLFFAVTAEQQGRSVTLWHLDRDDRCVSIASFAKDGLSVNHFLPGTLSFPGGSGDPSGFYFSGVALSGINGMTFRCAPDPG